MSVKEEFLGKEHKLLWIVQRYLQAEKKAKVMRKITSLSQKKVLDFGCGTAAFGIYIHENFDCKIDLYDCSLESINRAKNFSQFNGKISNRLEELGKNYDIITAWYVYEYVKIEEFWKEIDAKLKPGGFLFLSFRNVNSFYRRLKKVSITSPDLNYKLSTKDLPQNFKIHKIMQYPLPAYLLQKSSFLKTWVKRLIYWFETLLKNPYNYIYVLKKIPS